MAKNKADQDLLDLAKKRWKIASDAESENRRKALEDKEFAAGDQWDSAVRQQRELDKRPCLTVNRMPAYINQITNEQRQNRPSIQVNPVDDTGDEETAEVIQGIIRHIEYDSAADEAYDWAFEDGVTGGFGYMRIVTEYTDAMSFDQDIKIKRIKNPFSVYFDPGANETDFSDAGYGFVEEKMTREDFENQYPKSELKGTSWKPDGDGWLEKDRVRVCEYWWKEEETKEIILWSDGSVSEDKDRPKRVKEVQRRNTQIPNIKWAKITDCDVLERRDWPGKWIPIIPVIGKELDIDGKKVLKGIVRDAKDPQRQYNYMESAATEAIALAPKAPWVAAEGQLDGHEREWQNSNVTNRAVLTYKGITLAGQQAPAPQRIQAEPPIQAMSAMISRASDDMKSTTGIYDASLGVRSNETSGKGILARKQQADSGNFHFTDNLTRSLRHAGRVILDLFPHIYDTKRVMRAIGEDGAQSTVQIEPGAQPPDPNMPTPGVQRAFDVTVGKYDVTISTGPSYQTKRQEAWAMGTQLVQAFPAIMPVAGDIIVRNSDMPGADKIADRMEKMLPPQLQDDPQQPNPQVQQAQAHIQMLTQQLGQAQEEIKDKTNIKAMELESKERIAFEQLSFERDQRIPLDYEKLRVQLAVAELAAKTQANITQAEHEKELLSQQGAQAHEVGMAAMQAEQQQSLQAQQQQNQQPQQPQQTQQTQQQGGDNAETQQ